MLKFTECEFLPASYRGGERIICFRSVADILTGLFGKLAETKEVTVSYAAFALSPETVKEALAASADGSRVVIGEKENPLAVIEGKDPEKTVPGYTVHSAADLCDWVDIYQKRILGDFADRGVLFETFDGVILHPDAKIGEGTLIGAGTQIAAGVSVGKNCKIGPRCYLENCSVGDETVLIDTRVVEAVIDDHVKIGPYCNIRPKAHICSGCKIGDFVEVKNSTLGRDTHASHLTYIGDSDVGERVNFGCGVVTANYDGFNKFRTVIGSDAFIGCNTNLVAPVKIGDGAFTACGSTITDEVANDSLGIARARQVNKDGWAAHFREGKKKK